MDNNEDGLVSEDEFITACLSHKKVSTTLTLKIVDVFINVWWKINNKYFESFISVISISIELVSGGGWGQQDLYDAAAHPGGGGARGRGRHGGRHGRGPADRGGAEDEEAAGEGHVLRVWRGGGVKNTKQIQKLKITLKIYFNFQDDEDDDTV